MENNHWTLVQPRTLPQSKHPGVSWIQSRAKWRGSVYDTSERSESGRAKQYRTNYFADEDECNKARQELKRTIDERNASKDIQVTRSLPFSGTSSDAETLGDGPRQKEQTPRRASTGESEAGCFCDTDRHLPTNGISFEGVWIQCDDCNRWCHGECAGFDKVTVEEVETYSCPVCARNARKTDDAAESAVDQARSEGLTLQPSDNTAGHHGVSHKARPLHASMEHAGVNRTSTTIPAPKMGL